MRRISTAFIAFLLCAGAMLAFSTGVQAKTAQATDIGPVSNTWYFAEGRIGSGFLQWITVGNQSTIPCAVKIDLFYTYDGSQTSNTKTVSFTVPAQTRYTDSVNNNLGISQNEIGVTLSAKVSVDTGATPTCPGVVAERPMYFTNFHATSSGTNIIGATVNNLKNTFYFADVPTGTAGNSFLSILNPQDTTANIHITYYNANDGTVAGNDTMTVAPNSRGTFQPGNNNLPAHVSAVITSDQPILVERPSYFPLQFGVSGSADLMGTSTSSNDWYFAEGYTGTGTQEFIIVTNPNDTGDALVTGTLVHSDGSPNGFLTPATVTLAPHEQHIFGINQANANGSTQVAVHVNSSGATVVAERQMYTKYNGSNGGSNWATQGVTATLGAPSLQSTYSFAEGFTSLNFNEWLELFNPGSAMTIPPNPDATPTPTPTTSESEAITVTLVNMLGHTYSQTYHVTANSRATINITDMVVNHLVRAGDDARGYAVSMSVSSSSGVFVAERTMYWNAFGTEGSNAIVGFV